MLSRSQQQQLQFNNLDFRKKQIDTLKVFNDNVVEISPYEEYCVHFDSAGRKFILIVNLGLNFPNERPNLFITPIVQHKWVNTQTGEIERAPGLLNYSAHSDLGRVVQAVVRELERFPPEILNQNSTTTTTTINSPSNLYIDGINSTVSTQLAKSLDNNRSNYMMACTNQNNIIDASFTAPSGASESQILPNLSTLSLDELKQLDNDPEFFDDFIEEMSVVQHLNEELDSMINEVEVISRENVTKETNLIELKRKLSDDVTAIKNLGEKCDQLNKKYLKKSDEYAPQHIRELLQIAASNADTECDHHVEQFLNGKIDVQTFLNSYTHSKKLSSERKAKEERLGQQLSALERAGI